MLSTAGVLIASNQPYCVIEKRATEQCHIASYDGGNKTFVFPDGSVLEMRENGNINGWNGEANAQA